MTENRPLPPLPWPELERPLLPFLPLVYVAWADGELNDSEIAAISRRIEVDARLDGRCRERLAAWLDPDDPPAPRELAAMLRLVRVAGRGLAEPQRTTLAQLGLRLAALSAPDEDAPVPPEVAQAVAEVEEALGVVGHEASRVLLEPARGEALEPDRGKVPVAEVPAVFDLAALRGLLGGPYGETRREVFELLATPEFTYVYGLDTTSYREHVLAWCRELAERGLGGVAFPPGSGGEGDMGRFMAIFETLAFHDTSLVVKFGVQFGLFGGSILQLGTERHHREYLPRVADLSLPGCFAMSETGHGSNVRDLETVARYDPATQEFEIHTPTPAARKDWIGNAAAHGRLATVFAQLAIGEEEHGVHAFLVSIRDDGGRPMPGVGIEDCGLKEGLNGVDNGRLSFDRVRIPRESLLDRFASVAPDGTYESPIPSASKRFFTMLGTLVGGRISVARGALSATKSALAIAVRYGERRRQFGPAGEPEIPILDYLAHQRRLLPRLAAAYSFDAALAHLTERYLARTEEDSREIETLAAGLKAEASWLAVDTLQTGRECCGGQGYLVVNRFGPLKADLDIFTTFEGDNTVLLQLAAKGLLTGYRRELGELSFFNLVKYLGHRAALQLAALDPIAGRRTDQEHLRDPDFHRAAFRYREERLLIGVARRLKRAIDEGQDSFAAMNECQTHLIALARAFVERVVVEQAALRVEECEEPSVRQVLGDLAALYALWRLERARGWFLETGYFEPPKGRAIRALVDRLCRELRPQAEPLVDAFGIPDEVLAAPIAFDAMPEL